MSSSFLLCQTGKEVLGYTYQLSVLEETVFRVTSLSKVCKVLPTTLENFSFFITI